MIDKDNQIQLKIYNFFIKYKKSMKIVNLYHKSRGIKSKSKSKILSPP